MLRVMRRNQVFLDVTQNSDYSVASEFKGEVTEEKRWAPTWYKPWTWLHYRKYRVIKELKFFGISLVKNPLDPMCRISGTLLRANEVDKNGTMYSEDCLRKMADEIDTAHPITMGGNPFNPPGHPQPFKHMTIITRRDDESI